MKGLVGLLTAVAAARAREPEKPGEAWEMKEAFVLWEFLEPE